MYLLYFFISLLATCFGGICGIGGGVVIKPVFDAVGTLTVSAVSFLSGCTVLSMAVINVLKSRKIKGVLDFKISTPLAVGSVFGGITGEALFDFIKLLFNNEKYVGAVQAGLLIFVTLGSLIYSLNSEKIKTKVVTSIFACVVIGMFLGTVSSFLGIGGGPINLTVLFFFFSMDTKKAAANSIYIIMFSQLSGLFESLILKNVPEIDLFILVLVISAGLLGGILGSEINKKLSAATVDKLFMGFMIFIVCINIFNVLKFAVL